MEDILNICFAFVRAFTLKVWVQIFAYLISKVLCNIYQVCMSATRKPASQDLLQRLDQCVYPKFTSKVTLVISLHD